MPQFCWDVPLWTEQILIYFFFNTLRNLLFKRRQSYLQPETAVCQEGRDSKITIFRDLSYAILGEKIRQNPQYMHCLY